MRSIRSWLCAGALALPQLPAFAAGDPGWSGTVAMGHTFYTADCSYALSCNAGGGTAGKLGVGYQFGVFGLEGWLVDYGKAPLPPADHLRLDGVALNAAWRWKWGASMQGVVRAGVASVHQWRSAESARTTEPTMGLGVSFDAARSVAVELAWDVVTSTGSSEQTGTVVAQAVTLGLRVRF